MRYRATVLTPTLVGDGNKLQPIDYMVWRDQVNVLDQNRIFKLLSKGPRLEPYLAQLRKATKLDFASWGGFAQNFAGRRIPFEDAAYTPLWEKAPADTLGIPTFAASGAGPFLPGAAIKGALRTAWIYAHVKPAAVHDLAEKLPKDRIPRHPAEPLEHQTHADRLRWLAVSDSGVTTREAFRIHLLRVSTLIPVSAPTRKSAAAQTGASQHKSAAAQTGASPHTSAAAQTGSAGDLVAGAFSLAWKQSSFAEMASPGATFEGDWLEHSFLNEEHVRQSNRWGGPMTRERLFDAANRFAEKQLEIHAQYAQWTGLVPLAASISALRQKLATVSGEGGCLLALGWGAGFTSKSAVTGAEEADQRKLLGALPYYQRAIQSGLPFPKTRRIVFLKNQPATLPGWVEIKVQQESSK